MKKNGYINNRLRMNMMLKNNINLNKNVVNNAKKPIKKNNSSQRYLGMYQNEKLKNKSKNLLTPDVNKKSNKKTKLKFYDHQTLETNYTTLLDRNKEKNNFKNNNLNILSNSFDISTSFNIEDYMNLYINSGNKNPFLNKININEKNIDNNSKKIKEIVIAKYSFKNKKWLLVEELDNINKKTIDIYWKEFSGDDNKFENNINNDNNAKDFNGLEEKYNSLKLEYNKMKQLFSDLNNKYELVNKRNKESNAQINYYIIKIKEIEKDKEKYLKKNIKLKEEINKIPFLIEEEMKKFKEEAGRKISKKIYELEQENKILKGERYKSKERRIFNELELKCNGNPEEVKTKK